MLSLLLAAQMAGATEIAVSPLTAVLMGDLVYGADTCWTPVGGSIAALPRYGCYAAPNYIPLTPMIPGRWLDAVTICYLTDVSAPNYLGLRFEIIESVGAGTDVTLWSDGLWRTANPGVCEVIPVGVSPSGTPVLYIEPSMDVFSGDSVTIGQIWMTVSK